MNQKVRIEIAVGLIVAIAILLGIYVWNNSAQISTSTPVVNVITNQKQVAKQDVPTVEQSAQADVTSNIYTNSDYGFQFTLPKGWESYKSVVNNKDKASMGVSYVYIDLPTIDKSWPGDTDSTTKKSLMGYASMFAVSVWNMDSFNKHLVDCKKNSTPDCYTNDAILARGKTFVYEISAPQAMPEDLRGKGDYIQAIKDSFKMTALK